MLALIDGDIVCYRCAAVNENAAEGIAKWQADQLITRIVEETNASDWKVYLSGDNNFRYALYPEYKANRRDMVKPRWLEHLREHLVLEWNATIADGYEADDAIGIASQDTELGESVVCSIDKDLRQLPGHHYHFVNRQWLDIDEIEGWRNFYLQLLQGDTTDNIKGCPGIGPVKSEKLLRSLGSTDEFYAAAAEQFYAVFGVSWFDSLNLNAQLLYIWRRENDKWKAPIEWQPPSSWTPPVQEQVVKSSSLQDTVTTSTEGITTPAERVTSLSGGIKTESSSTTSEKQH